jgi:hypothetical protein
MRSSNGIGARGMIKGVETAAIHAPNMPSDPSLGGTEVREQKYREAFLSGAKERGYTFDGQRGFAIRGARLECFFYEPSMRQRIALTKKELKSRDYSSIAERGWKEILVPSGRLTFVFTVDGCSETRIVEPKRHPFEIDKILDRIDNLVDEISEERRQREKERAESRRRAAERAKSRKVEDGRWDAMQRMLDAVNRAEGLRRLIDRIDRQSPLRPDQARRVRKWVRWATAHADAIDPMAKDFDIVLSRLGATKALRAALRFRLHKAASREQIDSIAGAGPAMELSGFGNRNVLQMGGVQPGSTFGANFLHITYTYTVFARNYIVISST